MIYVQHDSRKKKKSLIWRGIIRRHGKVLTRGKDELGMEQGN